MSQHFDIAILGVDTLGGETLLELLEEREFPVATLYPLVSTEGELDSVRFAGLTMKNDQITGPVKTKFGYHVILMHDKRPARENSYDQVKELIVEQIKFQKQQEQYERIAEALRKKYNVQILLPAGPATGTGGPR